jgi:hypothetical protein
MDNNKVNKDNIDIFICTHIKCNIPVTNDAYKLISCGGKSIEGAILDNTGDNISHLNGFYCELTGIYWVWKNWNLKDYVGFCHYRRYFGFMDDIPNLDNTDYDVIILQPIQFDQTLYERYKECYNIADLDLVLNIAKNKYGVHHDDTINNNFLNARNMFIMSKDNFNKYCEFLFGVIDEYCKIKNIKSMADVYNQVLIDPGYKRKCRYKYQARFAGFLAEHLMQIWINWKNLKVHTVECIQTS